MMSAMTNPWRALIKHFGGRKWFATVFHGVAPVADRFLYRLTRGRVTVLSGTGIKTLMLTTTGRKSGEPRTVPLLYSTVDGSWIIVGSNWGQKQTPAWVLNLLADPRATVGIHGVATPVAARVVEGEERERLWTAVLTRNWPGFEDYAGRADRHINIFALEPVGKG
jgi:deazaflavin-dependent oxidoreductase (nitroreductase family)